MLIKFSNINSYFGTKCTCKTPRVPLYKSKIVEIILGCLLSKIEI